MDAAPCRSQIVDRRDSCINDDRFYKEGEVLSLGQEAAFAAQVIRVALQADAMGGIFQSRCQRHRARARTRVLLRWMQAKLSKSVSAAFKLNVNTLQIV